MSERKPKKVKKFRPNIGEPKFQYFSTCHTAKANKPALRACGNIGTHLGAIPNTDDQTEGLGGWRCSACGKPCNCTRQKAEKAAPTSTDGSEHAIQ